MSTAHDPLVLPCITVPSVARTFGIPLERQDLLVCNNLDHRDLKTQSHVNVRISIALYPAAATY